MIIHNKEFIDMEGIDEDDDQELVTNGNSSDLPCQIIVTNVANEVFDNVEEKEFFESLFKRIEEDATFHYFKSFRRVRVDFSTPAFAVEAKHIVHLTPVCNQAIKCYFNQPILLSNNTPYLAPPEREKQFLLSPPSSPPLDWEPMTEAHPFINYDLISAVANLSPGDTHELHPPAGDHPAIVVQVCEDAENGPRPQIMQTRCPERSQ